MKSWKHLFITFGFLLAAMTCYLIGYNPGFRIFFAAGALFETIFWVRLLNRRYKSDRRLKELKESAS